jgi:hypothetical protein
MRQAETVKMAQTLAANSSNAEREVVDLYNFATGSNIEAPIYPNSFDEDDLVQLLTDTVQVLTNSFGPKLKATQVIKYLRQAYRDLPVEDRLALELEAQTVSVQPPAAPGQDRPEAGMDPAADAASSAAVTATPETGAETATTNAGTGTTAATQPLSTKSAIREEGDIRIKAPVKRIDPADILSQHGLDQGFERELQQKIKDEGYDPAYPILSVETVHGHIVLDGHHRGNASKALGLDRIPAYSVPYDEYRQLLDAKFAGVRPKKLSDLDQYIYVKVPGTKGEVPYSQVRESNSHTNAGNPTAPASSAASAASTAASTGTSGAASSV